MFGLVRLGILCCVAFIAGVFYERADQSEACTSAGGAMQAGLCVGAGK